MKINAKYRSSLAAAMACGLVATVSAAALSSSATATDPETFDVVLADSGPDGVTDGGRRGPSPGDSLVFRAPLKPEGNLIATADLVGGGAAQFVTTIRIPGRGTLTAQGKLRFFQDSQGILVVTGGSGEFSGADGTVTVTAGRRERITFSVKLS